MGFEEDVEVALPGARLVLVRREWREYRELDPDLVWSLVRDRRGLDGRNCLDPEKWRAADLTSRALGRQ